MRKWAQLICISALSQITFEWAFVLVRFGSPPFYLWPIWPRSWIYIANLGSNFQLLPVGNGQMNTARAAQYNTDRSKGKQYSKDCNLTNASHWVSAALMNVAHRFPDEIIVLVHIAINECDTKSSTQLGILFSRSSEKMREMGTVMCAVNGATIWRERKKQTETTRTSRCCREGKQLVHIHTLEALNDLFMLWLWRRAHRAYTRMPLNGSVW